jgi:hypothetical protein
MATTALFQKEPSLPSSLRMSTRAYLHRQIDSPGLGWEDTENMVP